MTLILAKYTTQSITYFVTQENFILVSTTKDIFKVAFDETKTNVISAIMLI